MQTQSITFNNQHRATAIHIHHETELLTAIDVAGFPRSRPVMVLVGGAAKAEAYQNEIESVTPVIAKAASENGAIVISGGTEAGIMAAIGQVRAQEGYHFPLVGVAVRNLVNWDNAAQEDERTALEPHHTHFIFVPGNDWGDESPWLAQIAGLLAGDKPSVTILVNGGKVSREDVRHSLEHGRPVIAIQGTGRLADELADISYLVHRLDTVSVHNKAALAEMLHTRLAPLPISV